jgi:hypothetical protein
VRILSLIAAAFLVACAVTQANAASFQVSKVSWTGDGLHIEVKTDVPDGTQLNVGISDEKTGDNLVSGPVLATVSNGQLVVDGFATDRDEKPIRPGRYWLSIAENILPVIGTPPITIPKRPKQSGAAADKERQADAEDEDASPDPVSGVKQLWVDDVLRIEGKISVPDGTWLNIAVQDNDGTQVADEGFICAQVKSGRFIVEGFTKDGIEPLTPGRYILSIQAQNPLESGALAVEKSITVTKRPRPRRSRLAAVRAINVANYGKAKNNEPAATSLAGVSDFVREESDMQLHHTAEKKKQSAIQKQRKSDTNDDDPVLLGPDEEQARQPTRRAADDEVTVRRADGMKFIALASDPDVMAQLAADLIADDEEDAEALAHDGRLCFLKDNTKVSIIERGPMFTVVRVLNGPHKGRRGLVATEAINE